MLGLYYFIKVYLKGDYQFSKHETFLHIKKLN